MAILRISSCLFPIFASTITVQRRKEKQKEVMPMNILSVMGLVAYVPVLVLMRLVEKYK